VSTHPRSVSRVLVTLLLVLGVAACGIPKDAEPRLIAEEPGLSPTTPPATVGPGGSGAVTVFFIDPVPDDPVLVERERATEEGEGPIEAVNRLLSGITPEEDAEGLISRIPRGTELRDTSTVDNGVATLDLSAEIADIAGPNQVQAYAQIVFTVTQDPDVVWRVRFLIEGEPDNVPTLDEGDLPEVTRGNYRDLRPRP